MEFDQLANTTAKSRDRSKSITKLHKDPPSTLSSSRSLKKYQSAASLQRHPSAPVYPRSSYISSLSGRDRTRTQSSAYTSSNSSLDLHSSRQSPNLADRQSGASAYMARPDFSSSNRQSLNEKGSDDLIGAPFDASGILNTVDNTKTPNYQAARRPPPPPLMHTTTNPDQRNMAPPLRQSMSFNVGDRSTDNTPPRSDNGMTGDKRHSDDSVSGKTSALGKKKGGFSSFMNSMLGSPRNIKISHPENPVHMIHVGYDNETGQFTVSRSLVLLL